MFTTAIGIGNVDLRLIAVGDAADENELFSVRREAEGGVDVADQEARSAAQDRHDVEIAEIVGVFVRAREVDVVAIGRKTQASEEDGIGRENLDVAFRGHIADPQALLVALHAGIDNVAAIRRYGYVNCFSAVGEPGDAHVLQIEGTRARPEFVGAEGCQYEQAQNNRGDSAAGNIPLVHAINKSDARRCGRRRARSACGESGRGRTDRAYSSRAGVAFETLQIRAKIGGALIAKVAILLHGFVDQLFKLEGNVRIEAHGRHRGLVQDGVENRAGTVAFEGENAGGHLKEDDAEGKKIGAGVQRFPEDLLRRHVRHRAECRSRTGEMFGVDGDGGQRGALAWIAAGGDLGQTEIENLGVTALDDENVGGLDVAMNDASGVRGIQSVGDIDGQIEKLLDLEGLAGDHVLE